WVSNSGLIPRCVLAFTRVVGHTGSLSGRAGFRGRGKRYGLSAPSGCGDGASGGEALDPAALPGRLDGARVVVGAGPGGGFGGGDAGQDGQAGDDGAGAAAGAAAGDFDPLARTGVLRQGADQADRLIAVARQQEGRPVDPLVRPGQPGVVAAAHPAAAQVEAPV